MVRGPQARRFAVALAIVVGAAFVTLTGPSGADVTAVKGSAYGYFTRVSLFAGPANNRPCADPPMNTLDCRPRPSVSLPPAGSVVPVTATAATGDARYGPGIIFTSGPITVSTQGTIGATGSVTSSTNIMSINTSGQEVFTAAAATSTCTATQSGVSGSTTITNGRLQTSDGNPNVDGDETFVNVPATPAPNTTYTGVINGVGDTFRYIFNEQITNPDGSLTVNAGHQVLIGPTAVGDLIFGQSICGVTATATTSSTAGPGSTAGPSSTAGPTSSTAGPTSSTAGPTSSTAAPTSSTVGPTSSTAGPTTSTTAASPTTTTAPTTTTTAPTTTTTAPTTTTLGSTSTTVGSTTTTLSTNACTAQLQATRAQVNSRIDAARAQLIAQAASVPAAQRDAYLAQLEAARAQANGQLDRAVSDCPR